jgi:hypothetical protein
MQVLFVMWLVLAGIKAGIWEEYDTGSSAPARTSEVVAAEGPANPPPKP